MESDPHQVLDRIEQRVALLEQLVRSAGKDTTVSASIQYATSGIQSCTQDRQDLAQLLTKEQLIFGESGALQLMSHTCDVEGNVQLIKLRQDFLENLNARLTKLDRLRPALDQMDMESYIKSKQDVTKVFANQAKLNETAMSNATETVELLLRYRGIVDALNDQFLRMDHVLTTIEENGS
eukprot:Clim_evm7s86 gene=Clim_evmTU7s86